MTVQELIRVYLVLVLAMVLMPTATAGDLQSQWMAQATNLSGRFDADWQRMRNAYRLPHGWLYARNDQRQLHLLFDMTGDTRNDRPLGEAPWGDYLALSFDVDGNRAISVNRDLRLGTFRATHRLGRQLFRGVDRYSGLGATEAKLMAGFDVSPAVRQRHRIWEVALPLAEIGATAGGRVRLGVTLHSVRPAFQEEFPPGHSRDLREMIEIDLAAKPKPLAVMRLAPDALRNLQSRRQVIVRPALKELPQGFRLANPGLTGTSPPCPTPEGEPVKRAILANGTVELTYANGSKKINYRGGWKILCPDGTEVPTMVLFSSQVPPTLPPQLPNETEAEWLEYHGNQLLGMIRTLVNDDAMVESYVATEGEAWSPYQRIQTRGETISHLLAE